jgi:hypothetical protein
MRIDRSILEQAAPLFDRLVSQDKQLVWNFEAEHLRGLFLLS